MKRRKWTLVELMMVIAIIALLGAIAFPELVTSRRTSMDRVKAENIKLVASAVGCYLAAHPASSMQDIDQLEDIKDYLNPSNDTEEEFVVGGQSIIFENGVASYPDLP